MRIRDEIDNFRLSLELDRVCAEYEYVPHVWSRRLLVADVVSCVRMEFLNPSDGIGSK